MSRGLLRTQDRLVDIIEGIQGLKSGGYSAERELKGSATMSGNKLLTAIELLVITL